MLHRYFLSGMSNRFNPKFYSDTADDGEWTMPNLHFNMINAISEATEENPDLKCCLDGFKQYLFLQKSENTNRYWKVVIGIWHSMKDCENGFDPERIIRVTTDEFHKIVRDKRSGKLYEELPLSVWESYDGRMFY